MKAFAQTHGYRLRNLHDGHPVPPLRKTTPRMSHGYKSDRHDAILCEFGYVDSQDNETIGWCLLTDSERKLNHRLRKLELLDGVTVNQLGDTEASGVAPKSSIHCVLGVLKPLRIKKSEIQGIL